MAASLAPTRHGTILGLSAQDVSGRRSLLLVERGGRVRPAVIPDRGYACAPQSGPDARPTVLDALYGRVERLSGRSLPHYIGHRRIKHLARVYVDGDTHTQTVEGFFGLFKNGVRGVYHSISVQVFAALSRRVRLPLQPALLLVKAYVLGDAGSGPEEFAKRVGRIEESPRTPHRPDDHTLAIVPNRIPE